MFRLSHDIFSSYFSRILSVCWIITAIEHPTIGQVTSVKHICIGGGARINWRIRYRNWIQQDIITLGRMCGEWCNRTIKLEFHQFIKMSFRRNMSVCGWFCVLWRQVKMGFLGQNQRDSRCWEEWSLYIHSLKQEVGGASSHWDFEMAIRHQCQQSNQWLVLIWHCVKYKVDIFGIV